MTKRTKEQIEAEIADVKETLYDLEGATWVRFSNELEALESELQDLIEHLGEPANEN